MFIMSVKKSKIYIIVFTIILIVGCLLFFCSGVLKNEHNNKQDKIYNIDASNNTARVAFLNQLGWDVSSTPIEVCDVYIPLEFNETYKKYNEIQVEQGLDLSGYKGKVAIRYTYCVNNYPNIENGIYADILVLDKDIIGGDICSAEYGGFMHTFEYPPKDNKGIANSNNNSSTSDLQNDDKKESL